MAKTWARAIWVVALAAAPVLGASHPAGVTYPLHPAALQPAGLAQPLPSSRRYVMVWKDQLIPDGYSAGQKSFVTTHYVGTQKLFQRQIDDYRTANPNFLMLVYHLSYGLNGNDQTAPVGNITGANRFGQEDTDSFTPYVAAHTLTRENAYQHSATPATAGNRVAYPDPYWLMDIASPEWRQYLFDTLLTWQGYPTTKATGVFLDVGFPPWYQYTPDMWWAGPAGGGSRAALAAWWNPRAKAYFDAMRTAFAAGGGHPRYLVIPNPDALVDGTDEPAFLDGTDGVFTENWQTAMANPGDWNLSARRICKYVTGKAKVWMADVTAAGTSLTQAERELLIGSYLLLRNGTSYIMFGNGDLTWYPEYELDLGGYQAEPPEDLEQLRVAGSGGAAGGLYVRQHVSGLVAVNSSAAALTLTVPAAMKRARWSGGGTIANDGTLAAQTLAYDVDVPAGTLSVPARSVVILRVPAGAPPAGQEPGSVAADGGVSADSGSATDSGGGAADGTVASGDGGGSGGGGCGCRTAPRSSGAPLWLALAGVVVVARRRRR